MARTVLMTRRRLLGIAVGLLAGGVAHALSNAARAHSLTSSVRQASPGRPTAARSATAAAPLQDLPRLIPDRDDILRSLFMTDLDLAASRLGLRRPADDAPDAVVVEYVNALFDGGIASGPFISGVDAYARRAPARRNYLAFGVSNMGQIARVGEPPEEFEVVQGRFDPSATDAALSACAECVPATRETHEGVPFYSWGDDFNMEVTRGLAPPAYDSLGRGGRLAVQPDHVYRTLWTEGMRMAIETGLGRRPSLGDIPTAGALVGGLSTLDTYSLFLTMDTAGQEASFYSVASSGPGGSPELARSVVDPATLLRPFSAVALGVGRDDGGHYMTVALSHLTEQHAAENVEILPRRIAQTPSVRSKQPWSELLGDVEARSDQRLMVAKIRQRGGGRTLWYDWFMNRDSLLVYG
jgi:hypothetical protein